MPQWRKLHVKSVESLDINDMPDDFTRLMWVLLPLGLDCEGRGIDNISWIKSKIFPLRADVTNKMIETAMAWYAKRKMVKRYSVEGRSYFYIPTFHQYQGTCEREARSNFPQPPGDNHSREGQEEVASKSVLDVDSDVDSERDSPPNGGISPELKEPWIHRFDLEAHFCQVSGLAPPNHSDIKGTQKLWWTPLDSIWGLVGKDTERAHNLIAAACHELRELTYSDPNSIVKTARSINARHNRPASNNGYTPA